MTITKLLRISMLLLLLAFVLPGCALQKRIDPVQNTFLEDVDITSKEENLPFGHSWLAKDSDRGNYSKVYIEPIRTDLIPAEDWKANSNSVIRSEADYRREVKLVATYFRDELVKEIQNYPQTRFQIVSKAAADTIVVRITFTEVEFSQPVVRAAALAAPVPGVGVAVSAVSDPHVAFAARFSDGGTGKLLATIADRRFPPTRIVDLNKLTVTSSAREVCAIWAKIIAEGLNSDKLTKVKQQGSFSLLPW